MDRSTINSYETVMQGFPLPAFILHVDLTVHSWNEAAESCWGWSAQEVIGQLIPLLDPEDAAFSRQIWHSFLKKRQSIQLPNTTFLHKSGEHSAATLLVSPLFDDKNEPFGAFFCQLPSSTQQNASKPLFQGLMDLRYAFDQIACVAIFDARGTIQYANANLTDVTGFCPNALLGQAWTILLDSSEEVLPTIRSQIKRKKAWSGKLSISTQDDSKKVLRATLIPVYDVNGVRFQHIFIGTDITETEHLEQELDFLVHHNELTHLLNKRGFLREGQVLFSKASDDFPISLILFDIDRFKVINDSFGTHVGDQLLQALAKRLSQHAKQLLTFHPTSDLFGLLLKVTDRNALFQYARKLQQVLQRPYYINGHSLIISCTFGITVYPSEAKSLEDLYRRSEMALYAGKSIGTGTIQYLTHEMDEQFTRKLQLERSLFTALEDQALHLVYQPIINLKTKHVDGFEALLRWNHTALGSIPPDEFIPLAEEAALITPINNWVVIEACERLAIWQKRIAADLTMAINISPHQFQSDSFVRTLQHVVTQKIINPQFVTLELTENIAILQTQRTIERMQLIKALGFRLSIDDFGTGYSSLQYLRAFPIDELKIDKVFIDGIDLGENGLLDSIIQLGQNLKLNLVAEGVETATALHYLQETPCQQMQGFIFSEPLSVDAVEHRFGSANSED
ncbi:bifunctional diguanylate cyclase/phosphodiesterase [Exiguobacterium sp. s166]|uniref:sensor domain-containing protein n=1 Tax=Exiguobacterium sp. s166 TaxID=2751204 RepID=UPI001BE99DB3|nr:bifunctional diguanylate cyclase/phosphodiesterase [Exiguobacterium sp. s166]